VWQRDGPDPPVLCAGWAAVLGEDVVGAGADPVPGPVAGAAEPAVVPPLPPAQPATPASTAASAAAASAIRIFTVAPSVLISLTTWCDAGQGGLVAVLRSLTANGRKVLRFRALSASDSIQSRCEDSWRT
jgi:hypothetical protein